MRRRRAGRSARSRSPAPSRAAASARTTCSSRRSSAAARGSRSRTRGCTASARRSRRRCSAGCCPTRCRAIPGLRLSSLYRPAGAENLVGGDFYDAFATDAGWMLLVGDVTGRGAAAAAETGQARHTLRTAGRLLSDPAAALRAAQPDARRPARADAVHGRDRACHRADHRRVLRRPSAPAADPGRRAARRRALRPDARARGATAAGSRSRSMLEPGDVLVLYTDGVTDAQGRGRALRRRAAAGGAAGRHGRRGRGRRDRSRVERVPGGSASRRHRRAGTRPTGQSCLTSAERTD